MTKHQLRQHIRTAKTRLTAEKISAAAISFASQADALITRSCSKTVLLYASLSDEVPTLEYLRVHAGDDVRIVLPCVVDAESLELRLYTTPEDLEVRGKYHIPEPTGPLFLDYETIDLALIPGMAFDTGGHRLGRGKGYYDRLLSHPHLRDVMKVGVCFDFQVVSEVPSEPHDYIMDQIMIISSE